MSATLEEGEIELPASNASSVPNRNQVKLTKNQKRNARRKGVKAKHVAKATADYELALEYRKLAKAEKKRADACVKSQFDMKWHTSIDFDGMRLDSDVLMLFHVPLAIGLELIENVAAQIEDIPLSKFKAMGGQANMFTQARRQYQFELVNSNLPSSLLLTHIKSYMALCGWKITRAMFCIVAGTSQYMHTDRGHYHSISLFVCIVARRIRFGRRGGEDFHVDMVPGDVLAFNGLVWHSGVENAADSCVCFMYFDRVGFYVTEEMKKDPAADKSRFGFTKMLSEEDWINYSATFTDAPDEYKLESLDSLAALPSSILRAFTPSSQWTLDS